MRIRGKVLQKFLSAFSSVLLLVNSFSPFVAVAPSVFAVEPLKANVTFDNGKNTFTISANTTDSVNYILTYKDKTQIEAVKGSAGTSLTNFTRDIYAGTCSAGVCTPNFVYRGILLMQDPTQNWFTEIKFSISDGKLIADSPTTPSSLDLTDADNTWLSNGPDITPTPQPTVTPTATPAPTATVTPTPTIEITPTVTATPTPKTLVSSPNGHVNSNVIETYSCRADSLNGCGLTTNQADYAPASVAIISGYGFLPTSIYTLVVSTDGLSQSFNITTDSTGGFTYSYTLYSTYHALYTVQLKDLNNQVIATTSFTDSVISATVDGGSVTNVSPGGTVNASVSVTLTGSDHWDSTKWVIGNNVATGCFNNSDHSTNATFTENFTITAPNTSGNYDVTFTTYTSSDHCNSGTTGVSTTLSNGIVVGPAVNPNFANTTQNGIACMADQPGMSGLTCTANDISVANVSGITLNGHGCRFPGDTINFTANWNVQSTATHRYNVGLWFATAGQSSALHGTCAASTLPSSPSPFFEATDDSCGDINSGSTGSVAITMTATCIASPGTTTLQLPYCASWDQQEKAGNQCTTPINTLPGSPSKCGCDTGFTLPITVPSAIKVVKSLVPSNDPGLFNLQVNGSTTSTSNNVGNGGTTGEVTVSNGSNTVGETQGTGTSLSNYTSSVSCVDQNNVNVPTTGSNPWTLTVGNGQNITCTITNTRKTGTLTVNKVVVPSNDTGKFNLQIDGSTAGTGANVGNGGTTGAISVNTGSHTVSETAGTSTSLSNYNAVISGDCASDGSVTVNSGDNKVCTITNTLKGGFIKIVKNTTGGDGTFNFTVSGKSPSTPSITTISGTGNTGLNSVTAGPGYSVSETVPDGWNLDSSSCDSGTPASFVVAPGGTVTCTFNDTKLATVTVIKNTTGADGTFEFTTTGGLGTGSFNISTSSNTGSQVFNNVTPGTYGVTENVPTNWSLNSSGCTGTNNTPSSFTVPAGGSVTCTFGDTAHGTLEIVKNTIGGDGTFDFTVTGPTAATPELTTVNGTKTTGAGTVIAGTYSVAEATQTGWTLTSSSCTDGTNSFTPTSFAIGVGKNITCTFTNTKLANIIINKVAQGGDGTFGFTTTGGLTPSTFNITTTSGTGSQSFNNINPGTYGVSEGTLPPGWVLSSATCDNTNSPSSITINAGTTVTCTFTNTKLPTLKVIKHVNNKFGGTLNASNFSLHVKSGSTDVSGSPANGSESGTTYTLATGTYTVSEDTPPTGYVQAGFSGDCDSRTGSITLAAGDNKTCTITNNDVQPLLTVTKIVVGGTAKVADFNLFVNNTQVYSGETNGFNAGTYTISETGSQTGNYTASFSGDCNGTNTVTLAIGDSKSCTITNTQKLGNLEVTKVVNWEGTTPDISKTFEICITGPSYLSPNCQNFGYLGETKTWTGLIPGDYSVNETDPGYQWTVTGSGVTASVPFDGGTVTKTVTNDWALGNLAITKVVDWKTVTPDASKVFTICIQGPSFSQPDCKEFAYLGETKTWTNLIAGAYTVSETDPGSNWTVTLPSTNPVAVPTSNQTAKATVTNTIKIGDLEVTKVVDWNGTTSDQNAKFSICVTGPSFPSPDCKDFGYLGETKTWSNVTPGDYTVTETDPGFGWSTVIATSPVTVPDGGKGSVTVTNTRDVGNITVAKIVDPADSSLWDISLTGNTPGSYTLGNGDSHEFNPLQTGTYSITETAHAGTNGNNYTSTYSCVSGESTVDGSGTTISDISLSKNQSITCTFTNSIKRGTVNVTKFLDDNANGTKDSSESGLVDWTMNLSSNGSQDTDSNGLATFSNVLPGTYNLSETGQDGWTLSNIYCDNQKQGGNDTTNNHSLTVAPDETVNCFVGNYQNGSITVIKKVVDPNGDPVSNGDSTPFDFSVTGQNAFTLSNGQSQNFSVKPGTYDVVETGNSNYAFGGCTAVYGNDSVGQEINQENTQGETVTLGSNDNVTVTCINKQLPGKITVHKIVDRNGNGKFSDNDPVDFTWSLGTDPNVLSGSYAMGSTNSTIVPNQYYVGENSPAGYHLVGWYPTNNENDYSCTNLPNDENNNYKVLPISVNVGPNGTSDFTICDARDTGTLIVHKLQDTDGSGNYSVHDSSDFTWGTDPSVTKYPMGGKEVLVTNNYNVYESSVAGYQFTGWFFGDPRDNDFSCTNLPEGSQYHSLPTNLAVEHNLTTEVTLCNQFVKPSLQISKTNDAGGGKNIGDLVTYTLTLTALGNKLTDVVLKDLLPKGFIFQNVVSIKLNGADITVADPHYHSPGTYYLPDMYANDQIVIKYTAKIDGSVYPGLYKDLAWASGLDNSSNKVLASAQPDGYVSTNFSGTSVNVGGTLSSNGNVNILHTQGEVLGASTSLPSTGASNIWVILASLLSVSGLIAMVFGLILNKKNNIVGKLTTFVLVALAFATFTTSAQATTGNLSIRLSQPKSPTGTNNFNITFVALDLSSSPSPITVKCYKKGPSDGGYSQFGNDISVSAGGNTDNCAVDGNLMNTTGTYQFYATAFNGTDTATSADEGVISVDYNTSNGPTTPSNYTKQQITTCQYKISFTTANDGVTNHVEIYRSKNTSFNLDGTTRITTLFIGPNQNGSFTDNVPDCGATWYYVIRAFDNLGNGSGVVGDTATQTTTSTSTTVNPTTGAIPVVNANLPGGNVLGTKSGEGNVLGAEASSSPTPEIINANARPTVTGSVKGAFDYVKTHKKISLAVIALIVLVVGGVVYLLKKRGNNG